MLHELEATMTADAQPPPMPASATRVAKPVLSNFGDIRRDQTTVLGQAVPFAGRRDDLEALYNAVRDALNGRRVQVAWVHGLPGVGKSRLLSELERGIGPVKRGFGWLRVVGYEPGAPPTLPGRALLTLVGGASVLKTQEPWFAVQLALADLLGEPAASDCMATVGPLLGLRRTDAPDDAEARQPEPSLEAAVALVADLCRHRAAHGPFVLQIDGIASKPEEIEALCRGLIDELTESPVAVLIETVQPPPQGVVVLERGLRPLDNKSSRALAKTLLRRLQGAPAELLDNVVQQSLGVPARVIDLVRGMVAAGEVVSEGEAWVWRPRTERGGPMGWDNGKRISSSALARVSTKLPDRIARLPAELRAVVDAAAIFGTELWFGGVLAVLRGSRSEVGDPLTERDRVALKAALMQLQAVDVLTFVEASRLPKELEFAFVHSPDPAAVVGEMDDDKRALYARLAAQWLAGKPRQDPIADAARIGVLFDRGGRARQSAQWLFEAGQAARAVGQLSRAQALYAAGCRNVTTDDADLAADLRIAHGGLLMRIGRYRDAEAQFLEALHMARCVDDDLRCGLAQLRLAQVDRHTGRYDVALKFLDGATKHLRSAGEHRYLADVSDETGLVHLARGEQDAYKTALSHFLKALALRRRSEDKRVVARSLCHIARIHMGRGHFEDANDAAAEAVTICNQIDERWTGAEARLVQGEVFAARGLYRQAMQQWEQAMVLATEVGDRFRRLELLLLQAETLLALDEWQQASALMMGVADLARDMGDPELSSGLHRVQAAIHLERQALDPAEQDSERAVHVAQESGARLAVARAQLVRGCVLGTRALGGAGAQATAMDRKATEAFEQALAAFEAMGDLVRMTSGLRSYTAYLQQRGGGPRLRAVQERLQAAEAELAQVSGTPLDPARS
jgi:tetratricopeptide (TPR) repeat protein